MRALSRFFILLTAVSLAALAVSNESAGRKRALLVGWTERDLNLGLEYKPSPLPGQRNVELIKTALQRVYGFSDETDLKCLVGSQVTKADVVAAFKDFLIKESHPDDTVIFYYSGHGTTYPDPEKPSNKSQAFMMYDTRRADDKSRVVLDTNTMLTGPEIGQLLKELKSTNVTVILDACHSSGGTRGSLLVMGVEEQGIAKAADPTLASWLNPNSSESEATVLAACDALEQAYATDDTLDAGYSYFTEALARALESGAKSYHDLITEVRFRVSRFVNNQTPQAYTKLDREVFGTKPIPAQDGYALFVNLDLETCMLEAGLLHGISEGNIVSIRIGSREIASARITQVGGARSSLEFIGKRLGVDELAKARATVVSGFDMSRMVVRFESAVRSLIPNARSESPRYKLWAGSGRWDYSIKGGSTGVSVINSQGQVIQRQVPEAKLPDVLDGLAMANAYRKLGAGSSRQGVKLDVEVVPCTWEKVKSTYLTTLHSEVKKAHPNGHGVQLDTEQQRYTFKVRLSSPPPGPKVEAAYLAVVEIEPSGFAKLAWPLQGQDGMAAWRQVASALPTDGQWRLLLRSESEKGALAFTNFKDGTVTYQNVMPFKTDATGSDVKNSTYKFIVTTDYVSYSNLVTRSRKRGGDSDFQEFLRAVETGEDMQRGGSPGEWSCHDVIIRVGS